MWGKREGRKKGQETESEHQRALARVWTRREAMKERG